MAMKGYGSFLKDIIKPQIRLPLFEILEKTFNKKIGRGPGGVYILYFTPLSRSTHTSIHLCKKTLWFGLDMKETINFIKSFKKR